MQRNTNLDVLRGIAVLGLLSLNIYYFAIFETGYINLANVPLSDSVIDWMNVLLFDGRFRSLFCLLFGAALYIQIEKYKDIEKVKTRLFWIVVFGLLHGYLLWPGDILVTYGLAGYLAVKYLEASDRKLMLHSVAYGVSGITMMLLLGSIDIAEPVIRGSETYYKVIDDLPQDALGHFIHNGVFYSIMLLVTPLITLWYSLGIMLAGIYCFKTGVFDVGLPKKLMPLALLIVLLLSIVTMYLKVINIYTLSVLLDGVIWVNAFFCALLVVHGVVRLRLKGVTFTWLQGVGRLALTCYISQSLLAVSYFYWLAPNAYEQYTRVEYLAVAVLLILLQLVFAPIYFRFFSQGPLEYMLRKLCAMKQERHYV